MSARPQGVTHPSIDELLDSTDSKYSLVIYGARRARQITGYFSQVGEYALEYVGPLVDAHPHEKPLSVALREIHQGLLVASEEDPVEAAKRAQEAALRTAQEETEALAAVTVDTDTDTDTGADADAKTDADTDADAEGSTEGGTVVEFPSGKE